MNSKVEWIGLITRDLRKAKTFYSLLGCAWQEGTPTAELPEPWCRGGVQTGLPDATATIGTLEFWFYVDQRATDGPAVSNTRICFKVEDIGRVVVGLKAAGLYLPCPYEGIASQELLLDPDGRQIELSL